MDSRMLLDMIDTNELGYCAPASFCCRLLPIDNIAVYGVSKGHYYGVESNSQVVLPMDFGILKVFPDICQKYHNLVFGPRVGLCVRQCS
jgi:hypothetical protein